MAMSGAEKARKWRMENPEKAKAAYRRSNQKRYWRDPVAANKARAERVRKNPLARRSTVSRYYKNHSEIIRMKCRDRYHADPSKDYMKHIRRKYGLTIEKYAALHAEQSGLCKICGNPERQKRDLSVDHDHSTGEVRGLLCMRCNVGLGSFSDDPIMLERAVAYLMSYSKCQ